ncbi:MAG: aminotransferase class V-fold PLP-dependent enzyme [Pirellulales bacterium]|nr:aminotransferase class V-fold PLP-dependent enzyme [Pirellulales bacterium]
MTTPKRIYLDNAATSWPKPESVYAAVDHYQRRIGTSPSRSVYAEAVQADRTIHAARAALSRLIDGEGPDRIAFALNGTDALNLAIHGTVRPGDHVVTSVVDHNSVLRPLRWLEDKGTIEVTRVECDSEGIVDPDEFRAAFRPNTRLAALVHASNVTGALQPVAEVGRIAREHGALFLVDAAQSLGHVAISVREMGIDLLAAPGHKGLLGPLGTGLLYIAPGVEDRLESVRQGGTGSRSDEDRQPDQTPDKYEPGNLNAMGIFGLKAGIEYVADRTVEAIRRHAVEMTRRLREGLSAIPGLRVYGPRDPQKLVGVVSITLDGYSPQELAAILDASFRVQVRAGIHCAPLMHRALGTLDSGGTVRFSLGPFTSTDEIDAAIDAVQAVSTVESRK